MDDTRDEAIATAPEVLQQPTPPPSDSPVTGSTDTHVAEPQDVKQMDIDEEIAPRDMLSPMSAEGDKQEETELPALSATDLGSPSMGYEFSNVRVSYIQKVSPWSSKILTNCSASTFLSFFLPTRGQ
jgi:glucose-induced degradation protein 4